MFSPDGAVRIVCVHFVSMAYIVLRESECRYLVIVIKRPETGETTDLILFFFKLHPKCPVATLFPLIHETKLDKID